MEEEMEPEARRLWEEAATQREMEPEASGEEEAAAAGVRKLGAMFLVEPAEPGESEESAQALDLLGRISAVLHPRKRGAKGKLLAELDNLIVDTEDDSVRFIQAERYGDAP